MKRYLVRENTCGYISYKLKNKQASTKEKVDISTKISPLVSSEKIQRKKHSDLHSLA